MERRRVPLGIKKDERRKHLQTHLPPSPRPAVFAKKRRKKRRKDVRTVITRMLEYLGCLPLASTNSYHVFSMHDSYADRGVRQQVLHV